jgi:molecular chaperone IbpA
MRHFDLTPLYRSTVGFDRLASLINSMGPLEGDTPAYPPYNIQLIGENQYRITMAVAGFAEADIEIEAKENSLTVRGEQTSTSESEESEFLHRGIATRTFERRFQLEEHVEVKGASLENGLLHINLEREIPEAMKPRSIAINGGGKGAKVIESKAKSQD